MNMEAEFIEPVTPASNFDKGNLWGNEDSGYHTSFTPGSIEVSNENLDPKTFSSKKASSSVEREDFQLSSSPKRKYARLKSNRTGLLHSIPNSPTPRRGKKRPFADEDAADQSYEFVPTPTSYIAGGIQRLHVDENYDVNLQLPHGYCPIRKAQSIPNEFYTLSDFSEVLSYPTTPVKKICRSNFTNKISPSHKSSPLRPINISCCPSKRTVKKLNFGSQLQCTDTSILQLSNNNKEPFLPKVAQVKTVRSTFKPQQKVDIITLLHDSPAINGILGYLDSKDIYNFSKVSCSWLQACEKVPKANLKRNEYIEFINNTKENCGSRDKNKESECSLYVKNKSTSSLKDINNLSHNHKHCSSPKRSPPGTPRTIRFKRFTKSASLDWRLQLCCVRCRQPAKVTREATGEEWAECGSATCAYQFCRFCNCERHPGKICSQYDLEQPSPSKKIKINYAVGAKKSRKNLRRLL